MWRLTSDWYISGHDSIPDHGSLGVFGDNIWLSTLALCNPCESEIHGNVGPVSVWDVSEPMRTTRYNHPKVGVR